MSNPVVPVVTLAVDEVLDVEELVEDAVLPVVSNPAVVPVVTLAVDEVLDVVPEELVKDAVEDVEVPDDVVAALVDDVVDAVLPVVVAFQGR